MFSEGLLKSFSCTVVRCGEANCLTMKLTAAEGFRARTERVVFS